MYESLIRDRKMWTLKVDDIKTVNAPAKSPLSVYVIKKGSSYMSYTRIAPFDER